jgi:PAS domain S-box-containing protein
MSVTLGGSGPEAAERQIAVHEVHITTTDSDGLIRLANALFSQASGFPLEEVVGKPHSVVRHPDTPGAVFKLFWARLQEGRPAVAYVTNRTADGGSYRLFVLVRPVEDGYVGVGVVPRSHYGDTVTGVYGALRAIETERTEQGVDRPGVLDAGVAELNRRLQALGLDSYDRLIAEALPAEVTARAAMSERAFTRPPARGPLGEILAATGELHREMDTLLDRLDIYRDMALSVASSGVAMMIASHQIARAVASARTVASGVAGETPVLRSVAEAMVTPAQAALDGTKRLIGLLDELRKQVADLRMAIASGHLHAEAVAGLVGEVVDGGTALPAFAEIAVLCEALYDAVVDMAVALAEVNGKLAAVSTETKQTAARLEDFRSFLAQWRTLMTRRRTTMRPVVQVEPIDRQLEASHGQLAELQRLRARVDSELLDLDIEAIGDALERIRDASRPFLLTRGQVG